MQAWVLVVGVAKAASCCYKQSLCSIGRDAYAVSQHAVLHSEWCYSPVDWLEEGIEHGILDELLQHPPALLQRLGQTGRRVGAQLAALLLGRGARHGGGVSAVG